MDKSLETLKTWARAHLRWYGQSAFQLRTDAGTVIFIDPFRVPAHARPADLILVTHPHPDHDDRKAIRGLLKPGTQEIRPRDGERHGQMEVSAGESIHIGSISVTGVAAYNLKSRFHPKSSGWLGYVIEVEGVRLYHAGDTDLVPEMPDLRPDIALLPVGGMVAMNALAAAEAAAMLKASLCIPMHFSMLLGGRRAGARFVKRLGAGGMTHPRA